MYVLMFNTDRRALGFTMSDSCLAHRKGFACCRQRRACAQGQELDCPLQFDNGQLELPHHYHQWIPPCSIRQVRRASQTTLQRRLPRDRLNRRLHAHADPKRRRVRKGGQRQLVHA